jgi:hypothetical protein
VSRAEAISCLYELLAEAERRMGSARRLVEPGWREGCPAQGVYFFFEPGEFRSNGDRRIVRVGTHAVSAGSRATLPGRLSQHRGSDGGRHPGGGNHRGSVFRKHVGHALLGRDLGCYPEARRSWGVDGSASGATRDHEAGLERQVSLVIRAMTLVWIGVAGEASSSSPRKVIERGAIALLSNAGRTPVDPPSPLWLGRFSPYREVRDSGLWNVHHVHDDPDPGFLDLVQDILKP